MDGLKKAYYRTYQQVFDIGMRCLHWRKPIVFSGAGCLKQVPDVLGKCGVEKVMVVTGSHVVKSLGPKLFAALEEAGMPYEVFSEVEANPSVTTVEKIRAQYVETGCSGFVALGGGSPMDATKGAAARVACPKKSCNDMAGVMRVGKTVPPIVAIPTTSGTGSETTIAAVITDVQTQPFSTETGHQTLFITVEADASFTGNVYKVGPQEVRVGYEYILKTSEFELMGLISALEVTDG